MRLNQIGNIHTLVSGTYMEHMRCFRNDVEAFSHVTLLVMLKQFQTKLGRKRGHQLFSNVLAEVRRAAASGAIVECPASQFMPEPLRITRDEFRQMMIRFSVMERSLIRFAIKTGMDIDEAATVTHRQAIILINLNKQIWHKNIVGLVRGLPRHIHSPYLLWASGSGGSDAEPLTDMKSKFQRSTNISWQTFERLAYDLFGSGY